MNWYRLASELEDAIYRASEISRINIDSGDIKMDSYLTELRDMWARNIKMGHILQLDNPEGYVPIYDDTIPEEQYDEYRNAIWRLMKMVESTR